MKCCRRRFSRLLSLALVGLFGGCVGVGTYDAAVTRNDELTGANERLEQRVAMLETANASLETARLDLIDSMEDMRQAQGQLEGNFRQLKQSEERLSENLAAREAALASSEQALAKREQELAELSSTYTGLVADLEAEVASGQIQIDQLREGLHLNVSQEIMFLSGSANLAAGGEAVVRTLAERLKTLPHDIEVQGHTDNVALQGSALYPSNWELAAARSAKVVRLFVESGVSPDRLTAVSFAEFAPIAPNDTPEGRAKNRRIEIRLEPVKHVAAAIAPPAEAVPPPEAAPVEAVAPVADAEPTIEADPKAATGPAAQSLPLPEPEPMIEMEPSTEMEPLPETEPIAELEPPADRESSPEAEPPPQVELPAAP
jgi:chemotaxis protein MotB